MSFWEQAQPLEPEDQWAGLLQGLQWSEGFAFFCVECPSFALRRELTLKLARQLSQWEVVEVEVEPHHNLLELLQRWPAGDKKPIFVVGGFETWLSPLDQNHPFLTSLNASRNRFPAACPHPMVWLAPEFVLTLLARDAPDFFSIRSGSFAFQEAAWVAPPLFPLGFGRVAHYRAEERQPLLHKSCDSLGYCLEQEDFLEATWFVYDVSSQLATLGYFRAALTLHNLHHRMLDRLDWKEPAALAGVRTSVLAAQVLCLYQWDSLFLAAPQEALAVFHRSKRGWAEEIRQLFLAQQLDAETVAYWLEPETVIWSTVVAAPQKLDSSHLPAAHQFYVAGFEALQRSGEIIPVVYLEESQRLFREQLGGDHPFLHIVAGLRGLALQRLGRLQEGVAQAQQSRRALEEFYGSLYPAQVMLELAAGETVFLPGLLARAQQIPQALGPWLECWEQRWGPLGYPTVLEPLRR